jgi:hypothetical protein
MTLSIKGIRPVTAALVLISAAIGFVIAQRVWLGTQTRALLGTPARQYAATKVDLSVPTPAGNLDSVRERALFHASRAFYVAPPPPVTPAAPPRPQYRLAGTFVIPRKPTVALLAPAGTGAPRKVHAGDEIDGWRVQAVENGRVVLEYNGERAEIVREVKASNGGLSRAALARPGSSAPVAGVHGSSPENGATAAAPRIRTLSGGPGPQAGLRGVSATQSQSRLETRLYRPPPQ